MNKKRGVLKFIVITVMIAAMLVFTAACGGDKEYGLDEVQLAGKLLSEVNFDCELYQVQEESVDNFITLEGAEKTIMYMGSGSYADSFGIFRLDSVDSAKTALENVISYMTDLQDSFRDYIPKEADKVQNAVTVQKGRYVVFCITSDTENAAAIIEDSFTELSGDGSQSNASGDTEDPAQEGEGDETGDFDGDNDNSRYPAIESNASIKDFGNVVLIGDTAYELYSYTDKTAEKYASYVNKAAKELAGQAKVYDVIIPLSSGITLPDNYYDKISSSNQKKAMGNIIDKLSDDVKAVNMYDNLMKHRNEYIYFRTDHHWTALGAYYGYEAFCDAKGVIPITLDRHESVEFEGFLGSFYNDTNKNKVLEKNPDTIEAYYPISPDTSLVYTTTKGSSNSWDVIYDVTDYPASIKYSTFIAGDNPFTVITNKNLQDGSSCVVVKESFGNAFVPFLVDHYEKVYVVDYRYWEGDLIDLAKEKKADDVIFLNNLSMIRSDYLTGKLGQIIK